MKKITSQIDELQKSFSLKSDLFKTHQSFCDLTIDSHGYQNFKLKDYEVLQFQHLRNTIFKEISKLISKIDSIKIPNKLKEKYYYLLNDLEENLKKLKVLLIEVKKILPLDCKQNMKDYLKLFDKLKNIFDSKFDLKEVILSDNTKPLSYIVANLNKIAA